MMPARRERCIPDGCDSRGDYQMRLPVCCASSQSYRAYFQGDCRGTDERDYSMMCCHNDAKYLYREECYRRLSPTRRDEPKGFCLGVQRGHKHGIIHIPVCDDSLAKSSTD